MLSRLLTAAVILGIMMLSPMLAVANTDMAYADTNSHVPLASTVGMEGFAIGDRSHDSSDLSVGNMGGLDGNDSELVDGNHFGSVVTDMGMFVTTWDTTASPGNSITIPVGGDTGTYAVDWGDGTVTEHIGNATHEYADPGTYSPDIR